MSKDALQSESGLLDWLPRTKLFPPEPNDTFIARPKLVQTIHRAIITHRLTLLSAPAGYGKTALLSEWIHTQAARQSMPVAWLSLDASENDRTHFLLALIGALRTLHPACGGRAQRLLANEDQFEKIDTQTELQMLIGLIIVDVLEYLPDPFVLVLDQYERIDDDLVHGAFDYLLRRLPASAHIVVSSETDPPLSFTRLRLSELAVEFRSEQLAYTREETAEYLHKRLTHSLSPQVLYDLFAYTEGWPYGIYLCGRELATGVRNGSGPSPILSPILAYFKDHVWLQQSVGIRRFLLETGILTSLNPLVCRQITGQLNAGDILLDLSRRNLFVVPMGDEHEDGIPGVRLTERNPLRYHRAFQQFLQHRLQQEMPDLVVELHLRAAEAVEEPTARLIHLIGARQWGLANREIRRLPGISIEARESAHLRAMLDSMSEETKTLLPELERLEAQLLATREPPAHANTMGLTQRQYQVLTLLAAGASNEEIANKLYVTLPTVKGHVSQIMRKLNARSRRKAVEQAIAHGLLDPLGTERETFSNGF